MISSAWPKPAGAREVLAPASNRTRGLVALLALFAGIVPAASRLNAQDIETFHVQGNVYMLAGAASNIAVQIGNDGVLVVDTGGRETRDQVLAAIRELSGGPIRWMINTHGHEDHTGGNETVSQAGLTLNGNPAGIIAHEEVSARMVEEDRPITEWPLNTFFEDRRDFYFNGEAVFLYHHPRGHTDGDVVVYFRGSDVLVAGDLFMTTTYPVIDADYGGGVDGFIEGLNNMLDIAVPAWLQEGGTYAIPGHGRVGDEADIIEYRDTIVIVRDRIADMIGVGMTLGTGSGGQTDTGLRPEVRERRRAVDDRHVYRGGLPGSCRGRGIANMRTLLGTAALIGILSGAQAGIAVAQRSQPPTAEERRTHRSDRLLGVGGERGLASPNDDSPQGRLRKPAAERRRQGGRQRVGSGSGQCRGTPVQGVRRGRHHPPTRPNTRDVDRPEHASD